MPKFSRSLSSRLDKTAFEFQKEIIDRLKLYHFGKSAIEYYSRNRKKDLEGHEFEDFKKRFKLISFKTDAEIKSIDHKEIIVVGDKFVENELADSVFVLNLSSFENWVFTSLKLCLKENPNALEEIVKKDNKGQVDVSVILAAIDLDDLVERIIESSMKNLRGMDTILGVFLKSCGIDRSKITTGITEKIYEHALCRNIIVHNRKRVNTNYIGNAGKNAWFKEGDILKITEELVFEEGDNLLGFMRDFRKIIK